VSSKYGGGYTRPLISSLSVFIGLNGISLSWYNLCNTGILSYSDIKKFFLIETLIEVKSGMVYPHRPLNLLKIVI